MYLYETHLHTCQASACGRSTGAEHVRFYKDIGFRITGDAVKSYTYMFLEFWNAFSNDKTLHKIVIPDSVEKLGDFIFNKCDGLDDVVIGKRVSSIGADIFTGAGTIPGNIIVHVRAQVPPAVTGFSHETYTIAEIIVPHGTLGAYQNDPVWGGFGNMHE